MPKAAGSRTASSTHARTWPITCSQSASACRNVNRPSASRAARRSAGSEPAPIQIGTGRCTGKRIDTGSDDLVEPPLERHQGLREVAAQELDLLLEPARPRLEVHSEPSVFELVPAFSDAEPESAAGQDVDFGRLLRDQRRLSLREDDHSRRQLEPGCRSGQVAEENEGLVERALRRVGGGQVRVHRHVSAEDVVVREEMRVPEVLSRFGEGTDRAVVGADLGLRKYDAQLQGGVMLRVYLLACKSIRRVE
jgi:hypothetical protein